MELTGTNRPIGSKSPPCMEIIPRPPGHPRGQGVQHTTQIQNRTLKPTRVDWTTWWLWRGARTRSHPELGRENPQRPWYCVSRHGRVGRRQVFQSTLFPSGQPPRSYAVAMVPRDCTSPHLPFDAGWSSPVARQAHNLKAAGSNPAPATNDVIIRPEPPFPLTRTAVFAFAGRWIDAEGPSSPPRRRKRCQVAAQLQAHRTAQVARIHHDRVDQ